MLLSELIAKLETLQAEHGDVPVVTDDKRRTYGGLPLVRSVEGEKLTKLQPTLYARPEVQRYLETVIVIKS
jgi:hypothetical protein